jgi:hypothetical protein
LAIFSGIAGGGGCVTAASELGLAVVPAGLSARRSRVAAAPAGWLSAGFVGKAAVAATGAAVASGGTLDFAGRDIGRLGSFLTIASAGGGPRGEGWTVDKGAG